MTKSKFICPQFPKFVDILGNIWRIEVLKYKDDDYFGDARADGYCSGPEKRIVLCDPSTYPGQEKENQEYLANSLKHTLRHEIVHAYFYESGLGDSSFVCNRPWAKNEEMVDWFASQGDRIFRTWQQCGCLWIMDPETWALYMTEKEKSKDENH